ncbi:Slp family lipoprotein [Rodentibacter caecimuris]|uniref:Slp family lipoprotein n=1 Tax=Rodentibacter caecimuris TaxID=1796644 RepID=UPI0013A09B53|nr:Slp family lipoprotein [Rodentibacter heylii]QIA76480.1 Slp family lipoprotein [Rodentibacter heylii]
MRVKVTLFLTAFSFLLTGCITSPQGLEKDRFSITDYRTISPQDLNCHCKTVRLGGKIIQSEILPNKTKIEVLSLPIANYSGKPILESQSQGRFIAYLDGFVDPENLKDRYITLGGVLSGKEEGKIEQANYSYPVVQIENYRLWTLTRHYYPLDHWNDWGFGNWRYRPWHTEPEIRYYLN